MNNPNELERLLQALVGMVCWEASFDASGRLCLSFGCFAMGQCDLEVAVDSPWEITDDEGGVVVNDDPRAEEALDLVESKVAVVLLDPETFGLFLWFADAVRLLGQTIYDKPIVLPQRLRSPPIVDSPRINVMSRQDGLE